MKKRRLFTIVAPSGAGKSTLVQAAAKAFPDQLAVVRSVTTRKRRDPEDDLHYRFVSVSDMLSLKESGKLLQYLKYAGNHYGVVKIDIDRLLATKHGILALVEDGVSQYRDAGYDPVVIRVKTIGQPLFPDKKRQLADVARARIDINEDATINNSFKDVDGLKRAVGELINVLKEYV